MICRTGPEIAPEENFTGTVFLLAFAAKNNNNTNKDSKINGGVYFAPERAPS